MLAYIGMRKTIRYLFCDKMVMNIYPQYYCWLMQQFLITLQSHLLRQCSLMLGSMWKLCNTQSIKSLKLLSVRIFPTPKTTDKQLFLTKHHYPSQNGGSCRVFWRLNY